VARPVMRGKLMGSQSAGSAAWVLLTARAKEVGRHARAAMKGDVEGVHDMRVAAKRLREVARLFRPLFAKTPWKGVRKMVDQLNDGLGAVRDLDVLSINLEWVAGQAPEASGLIEIVEGVWGEQRSQRHTALLQLWDKLHDRKGFLRRVVALGRSATERSKRVNRLPFEVFGYQTVVERAEEARALIAEARSHDDPEHLHAARKAVKRLKYAMEPLKDVLPALQQPYDAVAEAQEAMGLAHDFDVLAAEMSGYFEERGLSQTHSAQRAMAVVEDRRAELYAAARPPLERLADDGWYRALLDALD
jgi:CHAD domain-containing protein